MASSVLTTPTETPDILQNASADLSAGYASSMGLVDITLLTAGIALVVSVLVALRNERFFQRFLEVAGGLAVATYYAVHGIVAVAVFAIVSAPFYLLATADRSTQAALGKYALGAVVVFAGLALVGYVWKHLIVDPIRDNAEKHDLLPEPDSGSEEVQHGD